MNPNIEAKVRLFFQFGRFDASERLLKRQIASISNDPELHNLLAITYLKQSRFGEAICEFKTALKLNPEHLEAALNLSILLCDLGSYSQGQQVFDHIMALQYKSPTNEPSNVNRKIANQHLFCGKMYLDTGREHLASVEFKKALSLNSHDKNSKISYVSALLRGNHINKAIDELKHLMAHEENGQEVEIWLYLGLAYYKKGNKIESKLAWEKAQSLDSNHPLVNLFTSSEVQETA